MAFLYQYENEEQINVDLKCVICLEPFQSPVSNTCCDHIFCYECVEAWLHRKQSCPLCRHYFAEFVPLANERLLNELDQLLVRCNHCQAKDIKREKFEYHKKFDCSERLKLDSKKRKSVKHLTSLLKHTCNHQRLHVQLSKKMALMVGIYMFIYLLLVSALYHIIKILLEQRF